MPRKVRRVFLALVLLCTCVLCACRKEPQNPPTLRVLAWVGYDEPDFVHAIEKELGAKIIVKTYVGGDQMYQLIRTAPAGTYDVVDVDVEYGERLYREGALFPLAPALWTADDAFAPFRQGGPARTGDAVYGSVVRWGALGLVYNSEHVTADEAHSYSILWDPKLKDKIVAFDWYLPSMGVLSRYLGNPEPYALSKVELTKLESKLMELKPSIRSVHAATGDVIRDLGAQEAWVSFGIGEWAAAVLAEQGKPIAWTVPKEGGVMWVEALAIPKSATHEELSERFIQAVRRPENLAKLAWRQAYHSQVPRKSAYTHLSDDQRKLLKAENIDSLEELAQSLSIRRLPGPNTSEAEWMKVWSNFKLR